MQSPAMWASGRTGGRKPKLNAAKAATVRCMYEATGPDAKGGVDGVVLTGTAYLGGPQRLRSCVARNAAASWRCTPTRAVFPERRCIGER